MIPSLKAELVSRFKSLRENSNYHIANFLDPRFKSNFLGVPETEKARQKIMIEYMKNLINLLLTVINLHHLQHLLKGWKTMKLHPNTHAMLMTLFGTVSMKWQRIIIVIVAIKKNKIQLLTTWLDWLFLKDISNRSQSRPIYLVVS